MKLGISGTRKPSISYQQFEAIIDQLGLHIDTIVSGGAVGIDTYAKFYAQQHLLKLVEFLPDYAKFGKPAPMIRNQQIVDESDQVVCFTSSESRGTLDTIKRANRSNKLLKVIEI